MKFILVALIFLTQIDMIDARSGSSLEVLRALERSRLAMEGLKTTSTTSTTSTIPTTSTLESSTLTTLIPTTIPTPTLDLIDACEKEDLPSTNRIVPFLQSTTPHARASLFYEVDLIDEALFKIGVKCNEDWTRCPNLISEFHSAIDQQAKSNGVARPSLRHIVISTLGWCLISFGLVVIGFVCVVWLVQGRSATEVCSRLSSVLKVFGDCVAGPILRRLNRRNPVILDNVSSPSPAVPSTPNTWRRLFISYLETAVADWVSENPSTVTSPFSFLRVRSEPVADLELAAMPVSCTYYRM